MATSSLHIWFRPFDLLRPAGTLILLPLRLVICSSDRSGASIQRRRPESVLNGKSLPGCVAKTGGVMVSSASSQEAVEGSFLHEQPESIQMASFRV